MADIENLEFKKWTIRKMILYTAGIISGCLMIGYQGGQIKSRFVDDERRLARVEAWQETKDREEHERTMKKIYSCTYPFFNLKDLGIYSPLCNENYLVTNP